MSSRQRWGRSLLGALVFLAVTGCATKPGARAPANLTVVKQAIATYIDSGSYATELAAAAAPALAWVKARAQPGQPRLAIVFDLDETLLSNLRHMRAMDFGYVPGLWDEWVAAADAPVLDPVAAVYRAAREHGVTVFYLTGRREATRAGTEKNLRAAGLGDYAALHCKPDGFTGTTEAFKTATRRQLAAEGWTIIANIGDQASDLAGGFAERGFKLPNPFYRTY